MIWYNNNLNHSYTNQYYNISKVSSASNNAMMNIAITSTVTDGRTYSGSDNENVGKALIYKGGVAGRV